MKEPQFDQPRSPEKRKEQVQVVFGERGHEAEYVFTMPYSVSDDIPYTIIEPLRDLLEEQGWEVMNRQSRLEIRHAKEYGKRDDELVFSILRSVLGDGYELKTFG